MIQSADGDDDNDDNFDDDFNDYDDNDDDVLVTFFWKGLSWSAGQKSSSNWTWLR